MKGGSGRQSDSQDADGTVLAVWNRGGITELWVHAVSDGGTRPLRVHVRDPSFVNLQTMPAMSEGGMVADVIVAIASLDPVMGGVDR